MNSELKPCPFCQDGGNPKHLKIIYHSCESNLIKCMKCESSTCGYDTEEEAIKAWNTRYERTCRIVPHGHLFTLSNGTELYESACSECGSYLGDEDNYCSICGAKVVE